MQIISEIGLLGDTVNLYGILRDLSQIEPLEVKCHPDSKWFFDLLPKELNITITDEVQDGTIELDLIKAFQYGCTNDLHMSQCYHQQFGLSTLEHPIKPELEIPDIDVPVYDYILAPFSRSLPENQKWGLHRWQELSWKLNRNKNTTCVFGNSKYDPKINGMQLEYDRPLVEVINMIKKCRKGVISVVTGISHLAYITETTNILFTGQGNSGWGINPNAIKIENQNVCDITLEEIWEIFE